LRVVDRYRAVRHLDVCGAQHTTQVQPLRYQPVQGIAFEQGATKIEVDAGGAQDVNLSLNVFGDQAGAPAELHEIDEFTDAVHRIFELAGEHSWVDDHRQSALPRFVLEVR